MTPDEKLRKKNLRLGLILALVVVVLFVGAIVRIGVFGG